uniref:Ig-like domain-containing protein n=1 Tax=Sander lucioperca TaxID=283035 RepID=A0A8D0DCV2_SANLU
MIGRLAALILLSTLSLIQTSEVPHQISLTMVELGNSLSLTCSVSGIEAGLFYWYKLKFGHMVQTVAAGTFDKITLQEPFTNSRFTVTNVNAQHVLNITNVSKEDEATYLCQAGSAYTMKFINGTLLAVNDPKNLQTSVYVKQSPETESVQPGDSVTLQCSLLSKTKGNTDQCPGEHSVYWFRSGSGESHPGIIYTHSDKEEERSCVYSLSKTIQNSSDTGTYYCAVVMCGEILFGKGTKHLQCKLLPKNDHSINQQIALNCSSVAVLCPPLWYIFLEMAEITMVLLYSNM